MSELRTEISRRRTFAIISHPDAGKTTLTEKFLLYGGAIAQAGEVKGKRARAATSDWMEIEKQRGISVTSSVLQFQHSGFCINILDTPGHQDFSEDTYRTLMAADSAVMVIDGAKGVEPQTRKLFRVCAIRHIPIFTFINKMDRETKDPLELCEEVERELGIDTYAVNWPIGSGKEFQGVYDREKQRILFFQAEERGKKVGSAEVALDDPALEDMIGAQKAAALREEVELLGAGREFDMEAVRNGTLSPVFFGSALTTFGVEPFLEEFLRMTTPPLPCICAAGDLEGEKSLGSILAATHVTENLIKKNCMFYRKNDYLSMVGMLKGENVFTYPPYDQTQAAELIEQAREVVPFVIIDCGSTIASDVLSAVALMEADTVLRLVNCDLKSISYLSSQLPLLRDNKWDADKQLKVASNVKQREASSHVEQVLGSVSFQIPHSREVETQYLEGDMLAELGLKESRAFRKEIEKISKEVFGV